MFRDRREGHIEGMGEFCHRRFSLGQSVYDCSACGIGERCKNGIERPGGIFNRIVKYNDSTGFVKRKIKAVKRAHSKVDEYTEAERLPLFELSNAEALITFLHHDPLLISP